MTDKKWEIHISHFRNIQTDLCFERWPVLVSGKNGSGKTSFLEALYTLSNGRSFRTRNPRLLIQRSKKEARVELLRVPEGDSLRLVIVKNPRVFYQNKAATFRTVRKVFPVFYLGGRFWELIPMQPAWRRRLLDDSIDRIVEGYRALKRRFHHVREQRIRMLQRGIQLGDPEDETWLQTFIEHAIMVWRARAYLIRQIKKGIQFYWRRMFPSLEIDIRVTFGGIESRGYEVIVDEKTQWDRVLDYLVVSRDKEYEKGQCLFGPHRDDLEVVSPYGPFWETASAGQVRAFLLSWVLALDDMLQRLRDKRMSIFLDDFDAELDAERVKEWFSFLDDRRVIVTTHRSIWLRHKGPYQPFEIRRGKITQI